MIDKPKVGETVWLAFTDAASSVCAVTVAKVGRKYFEVTSDKRHRPIEFDMDSQHAGYWTESSRSSGWRGRICYRNQEALNAKVQAQEAIDIRALLQHTFDRWSSATFTLSQLRRIKAIVEEKDEQVTR